MNNAELIEIRVVDANNGIKHSYLVECDYNGQDLLDIVTEELTSKPDAWAVEAVPFRLLNDDGTVNGFAEV